MRILQLVHSPRLSGAEVLVKGIALLHQSAGHTVCIASLLPQQSDFEQARHELDAAGVICLFPQCHPGRIGKLLGLHRAIRHFKPDVIFAHATLAALYVRLLPLSAPVLWVMHSGANDFANHTLRRAERLLGWRAKAVIGVCQQNVADYLREVGHHPSLFVVPNGVDESRFANVDAHVTPAREAPAKQIVQVGRYVADKCQLDTIRAFAHVQRQQSDARLLLCGVIEDTAYHHAATALVHELGVADSVTICGPQSNIASILKSSAVFAMPSRNEAHSIGLLEALASGIPIVANRIPSFGFADSFDGVSLVDTTDETVFCDALLKSLDAPRAARQLAGYRLRDTAERYLAIAAEVLQPRPFATG